MRELNVDKANRLFHEHLHGRSEGDRGCQRCREASSYEEQCPRGLELSKRLRRELLRAR